MSATGSNSIQLASEHVRMMFKRNILVADQMGFARLNVKIGFNDIDDIDTSQIYWFYKMYLDEWMQHISRAIELNNNLINLL